MTRTVALALIAAAAAGMLGGQGQVVAFEVASLKVDTGTHMGWSMSQSKGQTSLVHIPLRDCIQMAFQVRDYSLEVPAWIDGVRLEITAKLPEGAPQSQFNRMLQTLLVERFKMVFHRESKMMNGYALVEAKGGLKIRPVNNPEGGKFGTYDGVVWGNGLSLGEIAGMLAKASDRPVQDMTGIQKLISFRVQWAPERTAPPVPSDKKL